MKKLECLRCGHKWWPSKFDEENGTPILPQTCPEYNCRSRYWNQPRKMKHAIEKARTKAMQNAI
jgi:hypothetical protein